MDSGIEVWYIQLSFTLQDVLYNKWRLQEIFSFFHFRCKDFNKSIIRLPSYTFEKSAVVLLHTSSYNPHVPAPQESYVILMNMSPVTGWASLPFNDSQSFLYDSCLMTTNVWYLTLVWIFTMVMYLLQTKRTDVFMKYCCPQIHLDKSMIGHQVFHTRKLYLHIM